MCLWFALCAGLLVSAQAPAADQRSTSRPGAGIDGTAWLNRVQAAAQRLNYSGNFVYQQGAQLQSSRITHATDHTGEHEKLEVLDGQAIEYIRHNDETKCYMPESRVVVTEKRPPGERFPGLLLGPAAGVASYYKISRVGNDRVAGRICDVTLLEPRDKLRYGYRLWTDQATGLLLKAQTYNVETSEVLDQVGFTDVVIGEAIEKSRLKPTTKSLEGWRFEKLETRAVDLTGAGWSVKSPVPGFQKLREVKRTFTDKREVGQIVFSDGLATISVFIESGSAPGATEGYASRGPINVVSKRHGDFWLTVVGETPAASIRQVANSVEYNRSTAK